MQQDAFDEVDGATPLDRQRDVIALLESVVNQTYRFESIEDARKVLAALAGSFKSLNYSAAGSAQHQRYVDEI